jgi:hypothetical protein
MIYAAFEQETSRYEFAQIVGSNEAAAIKVSQVDDVDGTALSLGHAYHGIAYVAQSHLHPPGRMKNQIGSAIPLR